MSRSRRVYNYGTLFYTQHQSAIPLPELKNYLRLNGKTKIQQFRESIQSYSTILGLIMQSLNNQTIQGLEQRMQAGSRNVSLQMQTGTELIKLHIDTALQESWDQKPIRFQDAVGRRYPIPLEVCGTFEGFLDFLKHAFKDTPILDAMKTGMSVFGDGVCNELAFTMLSEASDDVGISFQEPLPHWVTYPEDSKFKLPSLEFHGEMAYEDLYYQTAI
ncbi:hypothetical protein F5884DRAFT_836489 [Xylogone sp. PMI_703]|nr:hypothetical protein F5884DRAFT_836489 [Xylogone sp. PMI_703]